MTETEPPVVWQRVPQGWIEFVAFTDDDIAQRWWQAYLAPGRGVLDADTLGEMTRGFTAARELLRGSPYAVDELTPCAALALDSTVLLSPDQAPSSYPPAHWLAAESAAEAAAAGGV